MAEYMNSLVEEMIEEPIAAVHREKIIKMDMAVLRNLQVSRDINAVRAAFPEGLNASIAKMRDAMIEEYTKRNITKPTQEGFMTAVWNGKINIDIVPTQTSQQIVVTTQSGAKIATGSGCITTQQPLDAFMQRAVHMISCYTKEDKDAGVVSTVDVRLPAMFPDFNLLAMTSIASFINQKVPKPYESLTGTRWQQKLITIVGTMSLADRIVLNNAVLLNVVKAAEPNIEATKVYKIPTWVDKTTKSYIVESKMAVEEKGEKKLKPLMAWMSNVTPVRMNLATASNPNKQVGSFGPEIGWSQAAVSALGSTNVLSLALSLGLAPGLSETEVDIIRFVTVALAEYQKVSGAIKVHGSQMQLLYLYYSLKEYIKKHAKNKKITDLEVEREIRQNVHFSHVGLSTQSVASFSKLFNMDPDPEDFTNASFIAWNPSRFTSAAKSDAVVMASNDKSEFLEDMMANYGRRLIFREILEVSASPKYADGFPALFNYWETNVEDASYMELVDGVYGVHELKRVPEAHLEFSQKAVKQLLVFPFSPGTTRSHRILAVKGNKLLSVLDYDDVVDVLGVGNKRDETAEQTLLSLVVESQAPIRRAVPEPVAQPVNVALTTTTTVTTTTTTTPVVVDEVPLDEYVDADALNFS